MTEDEARCVVERIVNYRERHIELTDELIEALHVLLDCSRKENYNGNNRIHSEKN